MRFPKISIITPSYNQGNYLEETILSVINQNYPNLEYIVIDGGSTDNSVDIIKKYEQYISFWVSEPDQGMYYAIQKGFSKSTGDIMAWINSDDIFFPNAISRAVDIFTRYAAVEWLGGSLCQINEKSDIVCAVAQSKWNKYKYYRLDYQYIQQEGTFWRRSLWKKAGSYISTQFKLAGDLELWLRFFGHAEYYTLNVPLGCFRLRSQGQKSLELRELYNEESEKAIKSYPIKEADKKILRRYILYLRYIARIPFINNLKIFKEPIEDSILKYPSSFYFDQQQQKFLMVTEG